MDGTKITWGRLLNGSEFFEDWLQVGEARALDGTKTTWGRLANELNKRERAIANSWEHRIHTPLNFSVKFRLIFGGKNGFLG